LVSNNIKKTVLVITRWFPTSAEPNKCIFTKKILDQQAILKKNYSYIVIVPIPFYPKFIPKFFSKKYYNYSRVPYTTLNKNYKVYHPRYFKIPLVWFQKFEWYLYYFSVLKTIQNNSINFNILHSHGLFPCGFVAARISKYFSKPFVQHLHDGGILNLEKWKYKYYDYVLSNAEKLVAVSKKQKGIIVKVFGQSYSKKINIIYNGVDLRTFTRKKPKKNINNNKSIIAVGNLVKSKGFELLIKSFSKLNSKNIAYSLTIIGEGKERKSLEKLINKLKINSQVKLLGELNNNLLAHELSKHNIFALATKRETFGIVFLEAMACGLPLVAPRIAPLTEFINEESCIYFNKYDIGSLSNAISIASYKNWDRKQIIKNAEKYSIKEVANSIELIYDSF
jgi:glycosyltransferase involved in cell wall biosynthesis